MADEHQQDGRRERHQLGQRAEQLDVAALHAVVPDEEGEPDGAGARAIAPIAVERRVAGVIAA